MAKKKIFLDTDVVIASLLSKTKTGASFLLINNNEVEKLISQSVLEEIKYVSTRHNIKQSLTTKIIKKLKIHKPKESYINTEKKYLKYVLDKKDTHVLLGAHKSKSKFLVTFNIKHYLSADIKNDFNILVKTPGEILQHLRLD